MPSANPSSVYLPQAIHAEIIAHSQAGKPEEICGLLRGRDNRAAELFRAENLAEDKVNNYTVDPKALLLQFHFEDQGDEMMGIYHSHPISVAYPSGTDAWNAYYPDSTYFICSLEFDHAPVVRAFRMVPRFLELDDAQLAQLTAHIPFEEVRPGLFAHFQAEDEGKPALLATLGADASAPFYLVYGHDEAFGGLDVRLVTVREQAVVVEG
ncbi:MAG: M67 family metallopeptidase [Caldilineaceae bacterium]|nr:M67 family metallopeptidase [Caldilineaceae bacterium]MBP8108611.1 M67 family metallopeptidase [Caldilineaceae bacterium]MBP8121289.1 M67 family metallopeptidase [Caldilineaceae bacterium]MBP9070855.1 M67 family metallopeptidase [Caldilineaceae bacterium]